MSKTFTIRIPDILKSKPRTIEYLYTRIVEAEIGDRVLLDMKDVTFIRPYGVIALITIARISYKNCGFPIELLNLTEDVHKYLERVNIFEVCQEWIITNRILDSKWSRDPMTPKLLEVTSIRSMESLDHILERSDRIFKSWLSLKEFGQLRRVLSELCTNIVDHSHDFCGHVLIQVYKKDQEGRVVISIAVGDIGRGIKNSLQEVYREIGDNSLDYLLKAMSGLTSRPSGEGGLGLRTIDEITSNSEGYLWIRSDEAALYSTTKGSPQGIDALPIVQGTQVAAEWYSQSNT